MEVQFPQKLRCLFQPSRYKFIRGGRGSAKSWSVARALLVSGASRPLRILCTREVQKSIKQSVHQLLRDQIVALGLESFYEVLEHEVRGRNGSQFLFSGLSDLTADSIKSFEGVDIVWIEEAQTITSRSLKILVPTIRRPGSEIWATFNPELDTDPIYVMAVLEPPPDSISVEINYGDNPWFPAVLEQERQHAQATMPPSEYAHVWEGKCRPAVAGAIYANEIAEAEAHSRLARVPYDPMLKVHTVWDLGFNDSMAIIMVQRLASEIRVVDYIEDERRTIESYITDREQESLALREGWNWGNDYLPHDGFARRHQTGRSDADVLKSLGRRPLQIAGGDVEAGIRRARQLFPRVYFNMASPGVKQLVEHMRRYRRHINRQTGAAGAPVHDAHSHGADAYRYLAAVADDLSNEVRQEAPREEYAPAGGWMA
ncbi:PBSX family phage terminase large subunit [Kerstersia gyiorum]|uniref:PBSX family phage terminase large subunit n=1 Tax=Kerstersia gyiorum TaxID=206506 RepID=UPI00209E781E|nr:PBSX family phage terminase large subunit [Kerstersia gyiorum]MCP1679421.1 phage terminase large subunit [Kerstersia gyiorum]MCP1823924.1 phage terminase large subunit [Kerstersia gyiorum]MCP1827365.1 phage terminase large subunit [Kerstersia gyiorum]MCW2448986.1 phage terminase large subunit [Kerstersia gyiorum]